MRTFAIVPRRTMAKAPDRAEKPTGEPRSAAASGPEGPIPFVMAAFPAAHASPLPADPQRGLATRTNIGPFAGLAADWPMINAPQGPSRLTRSATPTHGPTRASHGLTIGKQRRTGKTPATDQATDHSDRPPRFDRSGRSPRRLAGDAKPASLVNPRIGRSGSFPRPPDAFSKRAPARRLLFGRTLEVGK